VPDLPMRYHLLAADVKCPACGACLAFVRVRGFGDLYQCVTGTPCRCQVMHYKNKATKTCGYSILYAWGSYGVWTACDQKPAAKG
jgi:hypothetical protein